MLVREGGRVRKNVMEDLPVTAPHADRVHGALLVVAADHRLEVPGRVLVPVFVGQVGCEGEAEQ